MRRAAVDFTIFLDDDDYIGGREFVAAMREAWRAGVAVAVPRAIRLVYRDCTHDHELLIPENLEMVEQWATLLRVGATFGIARAALERVGGFNVACQHDEWVEMLARMARLGMRFDYADVPSEETYHYVQHNVHERGHARRVAHESGAVRVVRDVFTRPRYPLTLAPPFSFEIGAEAPALA